MTMNQPQRRIEVVEDDFGEPTIPFERAPAHTRQGEIVVVAKPRAVAAAAATSPRGAVAIRPTKLDSSPEATLLGMAPLPRKPIATPVPEVAGEAASDAAETHLLRPSEAPASQETRWKSFEEIGLAPKKTASKAAKLIVSSYRLIGFGILTLIVIVLVGYIASTAFYFFNHSWIAPVAVSPRDEKVVALRSQLAAQQNERDQLAEELSLADRAVAAEQTFQIEFAKAIKHDLEGRKAELGRVRALANEAAATRAAIRKTNDDYSSSSAQRMGDEYQAGLIDRQQMLAGKFTLAQISSSNLSLAERQAQYEQQAAELAAQTASLDAILADKATDTAISYDVLRIKREYDDSKLELAKALAERERLRASVARQDEIVNDLESSAYLRALADHATVALVPYENLGHIAKGAPLYSCKLGMIACHQVGKVLEVLPGEIEVKHPHRDVMLRGQMIELHLDDGNAGQDEVLFAGGKPLGV